MTMRWLLGLLLVIGIAGITDPAPAAKWAGGCPKVKQTLAKVGRGPAGAPYAISKLYEHVGHEMTFYLKDFYVNRYGGFSTDPGGNTVQFTFTPIGGDPIALPPFAVTATTPSTLTFTVPDSRPSIGRLVVGPATITVKRGTTPLFEAFRQLILPPMNDVQTLVAQGASVEALAAIDRKGAVWIPLDFNGYGQNGESLPQCPTLLTPVTAFAVDFSLKKGDGEALPYLSFGHLKKNRIFLGDYVVFGLNMYGNRLQTALDVTPAGGNEVVLCALNDALQLVLMFQLQNPALGDRSSLLEIVRDGSPIKVKMENVSLDPDVADRLEHAPYDSNHLPCYPAEP
jgi:hypothetical protein